MANEKPTQEQYEQWAKQSAELAAKIAEIKRKRDELLEQTGCKKPLLMVGKKKAAYLRCLENYRAKVEAAKEADKELVRMQLRLRELDAKRGSGIGTGGWIAISVGAALLITTAVIVVVKMNRNN